MRKLSIFTLVLFLGTFFFTACLNTPSKSAADADSTATGDTIADSTVYGVCGDGTMMNTLQLVTDAGDTINFVTTDEDGNEVVQGGLLAGDRLAVIKGGELDGEQYAKKVINLTTLQGKWTSLDKNFEILEGGLIKSSVKAESHPWTSWKILNGQLLLNADTFDIDRLTADSLYLENHDGIFVYKRQE